MNTNDVIDARPETVSSLITFSSNPNTIVIPSYQRSYQWDASRVLDILKLSDPDNRAFGFIGTMVFVKDEGTDPEVVDGQQRLISIILSLCAFRDFLGEFIVKCSDPEVRSQLEEMKRDIQKENLLDSKSYSATEQKPRIKFNRKTYEAFRNIYLLGNRDYVHDEEVIKKELNTFNKNYENAKAYFWEKYPQPTKYVVTLLNLRLEKLKGLVVNAIYISEAQYAGEVFESINGTGVTLKLSELVKNYIFRNVKLEVAEVKWEEIQRNCNNKSEIIESIIKYDWQNKYDLTDDFEIFRSIRKTAVNVEQYLDRLLRISRIFAFYLSPSVNRFKYLKLVDNSNDKNHIIKQATVLRVLNVRQFMRLIIALDQIRDHVNIKSYVKLLDQLVNFQVRAKISGIGTNQMDSLYSSAAKAISKLVKDIEEGTVQPNHIKEHINTELFDRLHTILIKLSPDEEFKESFAKFSRTKSTNKDLYKYLLGKIENYLQKNELFIDTQDNHVTLEEIYPQTPSADWAKTDCTKEDIYRLGNATILTDQDNRKASNGTIEKKQLIFKESNLRINRDLAKLIEKEENTWSRAAIQLRGYELADHAKSIWKL